MPIKNTVAVTFGTVIVQSMRMGPLSLSPFPPARRMSSSSAMVCVQNHRSTPESSEWALAKGAVMAIPQAFPLVSPVTKIEVTTEPAATLEFTATTKSGRPIEGVWVGCIRRYFACGECLAG